MRESGVTEVHTDLTDSVDNGAPTTTRRYRAGPGRRATGVVRNSAGTRCFSSACCSATRDRQCLRPPRIRRDPEALDPYFRDDARPGRCRRSSDRGASAPRGLTAAFPPAGERPASRSSAGRRAPSAVIAPGLVLPCATLTIIDIDTDVIFGHRRGLGRPGATRRIGASVTRPVISVSHSEGPCSRCLLDSRIRSIG